MSDTIENQFWNNRTSCPAWCAELNKCCANTNGDCSLWNCPFAFWSRIYNRKE